MTISVRLIGALRHAAGTDKFTVKYRENFAVKELIEKITAQTPELKRNLTNSYLEDQRLNALVLVNASEISALNGLETILEDGDEVVLIPVVHGG
ncbi:TPA: MoaD/ThiS family protein [Candidatus Bathyarchaeota archaeon]|nr:MoaD/ThiS family protein [Candidatus Bathyarchaeota archaeon]